MIHLKHVLFISSTQEKHSSFMALDLNFAID